MKIWIAGFMVVLMVGGAVAQDGETVFSVEKRDEIVALIVDVLAAKDVAEKGGGFKAHFKRNWGKYLAGGVTAGTAYLVGENNDWFRGSGSSSPGIENYGTVIIVGSGDNSPVTISRDNNEQNER